MIKNDKQYQITKRKLNEFSEALVMLQQSEISKEVKDTQLLGIESNIETFNRELREYESLKKGCFNDIRIESLIDLHEILIKARIAKGWSQADLAERLGIQEQQIQRYEASDYESASLTRIIDVIEALEISLPTIKAKIKEPVFKKPVEISPEILKEAKSRLLKEKSLLMFNN